MEFLDRFRELSSKHVGLVIVLLALTLPFMILPTGGYGTTGVFFRGYILVAMTWGVGVYNDGTFFYGLEGLSLIIGSPMLLFAYLVQRYCSGRSSWKVPVLFGLLLITTYVVLFSPRMFGWYEYETLVYAGPFPITYILGLVLMRLVGAPQIDRPFEEQEGPSSWWNQQE